jgi:hypothetical protein
MANVAPIPNVSDTGSEILRHTLLLIQRPYTKQTGIGGEPASIESSHHFSVRVKWIWQTDESVGRTSLV